LIGALCVGQADRVNRLTSYAPKRETDHPVISRLWPAASGGPFFDDRFASFPALELAVWSRVQPPSGVPDTLVRHQGHQLGSPIGHRPNHQMLPDAKREYLPIPRPIVPEKFERTRFGAVRAQGHRENLKAFVADVFHRTVLWPSV